LLDNVPTEVFRETVKAAYSGESISTLGLKSLMGEVVSTLAEQLDINMEEELQSDKSKFQMKVR
jgi:hypothetical protein